MPSFIIKTDIIFLSSVLIRV